MNEAADRQAENIDVQAHRRMIEVLRSIRARARSLLVAERAGLLLGGVVGVVVIAALVDFVLRTPDWFRISLWVLGVVALAALIRRRVVPAARFSPSLTELALRIERSDAGRSAGLEGWLASGIELGDSSDSARAAGVVREASARLERLRAQTPGGAVLSTRLTMRSALLTTTSLLVAGALIAFSPSLAAIGAARVLLPWAGNQWPKRTEVADATSTRPHPRGSGFLLRATVTAHPTAFSSVRTDADLRVVGRYRLIVDGVESPVRRVLLTRQGGGEAGSAARDAREPSREPDRASIAGDGALYEYLVEPWGMTPAPDSDAGAKTAARQNVELEYWFETADDQTPPARVLLVEPPAVEAAYALIVPPEYARRRTPPAAPSGAPDDPSAAASPPPSDDPTAKPAPRSIELGAGDDERANPPAVLDGSTIELKVTLNKAIPAPAAAGATSAWVTRTLGADLGAMAKAGAPGFSVGVQESTITVKWRIEGPTRVQAALVDEHGIENVEQSAFFFDAVKDQPPRAAVMAPAEDKSVLSTATVVLRGEGRDDIGLAWTTLWGRVASPPSGSEGAPAEPSDEGVELARAEAAKSGPPAVMLRSETSLTLSSLGVKPGDEVWVTARAKDLYRVDGVEHDAVVSGVRKLRIISEEQFTEQVWSELSGLRRSAITMAEEQARLSRETARNAEASRLERSQAGLTDRIAREKQTLDQVERRLDENGMKDEAIREILREAGRAMDEAGKASVDAAGKLEQASQGEQKSGEPDAAARQKAQRSQDRAREQLEDLAQMLDQGEDTWSMKRSMERLLEEQKALRERTGKIGEETVGRQTRELTPEQRAALQQAAAEQKGLAQRAAEAVQKMMDAEQKVRKNDPAAADAMNEAARQAQRDELQQKMEQAAQQVEQNQTSTAQSRQEQAEQSMEQMLEQLRNTAKNRDEVLRRKLASLIDSLRGLVGAQEGQLAALADALGRGETKGLDRGMVRLNQNTLGVQDEAEQGPKELRQVADLIGDASEAQQTAIISLRAEPINPDEAGAQEEVSLEHLQEALALAEKLENDAKNRQTQRQRDDLKKAYAEAMARQVSLRQDAGALLGVEPTRRTRATARTIGEQQQALQDTLARLESETKELADAVVFTYAHRRLDQSMGKAATTLNQGTSDQTVAVSQDAAVRVLRGLVQALEDAQKSEDEFRQQEQAKQQGEGQQSSGESPLVPPAAEVRLLKIMQQEAIDLTRLAGESTNEADLRTAATLQQDLAEQAGALIRKMAEKQRGPQPKIQPAAPDVPRDEPPPEPAGQAPETGGAG